MDATIIVLGTGSPTGTTTAVQPHASAVGNWIQPTGGLDSEDVISFQLSGGATATIAIQTSMDGTTLDVPYTFTASGEIYEIPARANVLYRAICTAFTSGSPIVKAAISGDGQLKVYP